MESKVHFIAKTCHEANRIWCQANGDNSQTHWDEAEPWQRESALKGVEFVLSNPNEGDSATHNSWMKEKLETGWKYGPVKDAIQKTHPCLIPFDQLPEAQQKKDKLFRAIVNCLK